MTFLEVLVEGTSDVPVVREVLIRRLGKSEGMDFRIHPHQGKGHRPPNPLSRPDPKKRGLLDQLPAKLRAYNKMSSQRDLAVAVLVDADREDCRDLKAYLLSLRPRPAKTLFRIAVEELESWFLADSNALQRSFGSVRLGRIPGGGPDQVIGAWECLAIVLGADPAKVSGQDKTSWAEMIAPNLDLSAPKSPSFGSFVSGLERLLN